MKFTKEQLDFMRGDLENRANMGYSKIIAATRTRFKSEGRDFEKEFKEWKETQ